MSLVYVREQLAMVTMTMLISVLISAQTVRVEMRMVAERAGRAEGAAKGLMMMMTLRRSDIGLNLQGQGMVVLNCSRWRKGCCIMGKFLCSYHPYLF